MGWMGACKFLLQSADSTYYNKMTARRRSDGRRVADDEEEGRANA